MSRLLPPAPPLPVSQDRKGWAPHSSSLCILFCLRLKSHVQPSGCWTGIFTLMEPSDLNTPGCRFRKPALSTKCAPLCSRAVTPTEITLAVHSRAFPLLLCWVGSPPEVRNPVASMGRELPKPLDLQDRESGKVLKMLCPLCKRENQVFCTFLLSRCDCVRYRPIVNRVGRAVPY